MLAVAVAVMTIVSAAGCVPAGAGDDALADSATGGAGGGEGSGFGAGASAGGGELGVGAAGSGAAGTGAGAVGSGIEAADSGEPAAGAGVSAAGASEGRPGAWLAPNIEAVPWAPSVAAAGSCVLSAVTCVRAVASGASSGGFTAAAAAGPIGAVNGAALGAGAAMTFAAAAGDLRVVLGFVSAARRLAPVLTGWERSLTISGSRASRAAGTYAAAALAA